MEQNLAGKYRKLHALVLQYRDKKVADPAELEEIDRDEREILAPILERLLSNDEYHTFSPANFPR